jgi:hypothetical protein
MNVQPSELIVVLGPPGDIVLDVGRVGEILDHITEHVVWQASEREDRVLSPGIRFDPQDDDRPFHVHPRPKAPSTPADTEPAEPEPSEPGPEPGHVRTLRFFTADGDRLQLELLTDWWTFALEPTGENLGREWLEAEVHAVLAAAQPDLVVAAADASMTAPRLPPPGSWADQLEALHALLNDEIPSDRRGWAHNFFVHGWV